jgi:hypothetical protein
VGEFLTFANVDRATSKRASSAHSVFGRSRRSSKTASSASATTATNPSAPSSRISAAEHPRVSDRRPRARPARTWPTSSRRA